MQNRNTKPTRVFSGTVSKVRNKAKSDFQLIPVRGEALHAIKWLGALLARDFKLARWQGEAAALQTLLKGAAK